MHKHICIMLIYYQLDLSHTTLTGNAIVHQFLFIWT